MKFCLHLVFYHAICQAIPRKAVDRFHEMDCENFGELQTNLEVKERLKLSNFV